MNSKIENILKKLYKLPVSEGFYHNQPIMVTKNQIALDLFNGDVGLIRKDDQGKLKAYFKKSTSDVDSKDELLVVSPALISEWETVFAMTIHKSQGSEFDNVLVVLPKQEENRLLTRELLYTGVTRAKNSALIQAKISTIKQTTERTVNRISGIQERVKNK